MKSMKEREKDEKWTRERKRIRNEGVKEGRERRERNEMKGRKEKET